MRGVKAGLRGIQGSLPSSPKASSCCSRLCHDQDQNHDNDDDDDDHADDDDDDHFHNPHKVAKSSSFALYDHNWGFKSLKRLHLGQFDFMDHHMTRKLKMASNSSYCSKYSESNCIFVFAIASVFAIVFVFVS